jgi:hypothetical protein
MTEKRRKETGRIPKAMLSLLDVPFSGKTMRAV